MLKSFTGMLRSPGILMVLLFFNSFFLGSQPRILFAAITPRIEDPLTALISRTVNIEIEQLGFLVVPNLVKVPPVEDYQLFFEEAEKSGAVFIFLMKFDWGAENIETNVELIQSRSRDLILRREKVFSLDPELDAQIAREVKLYFEDEAVTIVLDEYLRDNPPGTAGEPETELASRDGASARGGLQPPNEIILSPGPGHKEVENLGEIDWTISVQGAPVIVFGKMRELFPYGAAVSVFGGIGIPAGNVTYETGLRGGVLQIYPDPDLPPGNVLSFLAGWELKARTALAPWFDLALRFSGGPAVVLLTNHGDRSLAKTVFFADGGIASGFRLSASVELGIELAYIAIFEDNEPIMGFMPSLVVRLYP